MPYNTTAIPPRKEVTGQTLLPLTRVKKIIAQDTDINLCSNNAAFVITVATEMFIQYLAQEGARQAKMDRKPRRNIQYKDLATAVTHQDNLEFLEDMIPKTVPYKQIKEKAAATRAKLTGQKQPSSEDSAAAAAASLSSAAAATLNNGLSPKPAGSKPTANGSAASVLMAVDDPVEDPSDQLQMEMRQAAQHRDVDMLE